jgi:acyl-CoA thioesterase FadM
LSNNKITKKDSFSELPLVTKNKKVSDISYKIVWDEEGKPQIQNLENNDAKPYVSLTHDHKICVVTAGFYDQGCDIEPILSRTNEEWKSLLVNHLNIWQKVAQQTDENTSGTLIWSVVESVKKSAKTKGNFHLSLLNSDKNGFVFDVSDQDFTIKVTAVIFEGSYPGKRVFSCVVREIQKNKADKDKAGLAIQTSDELVKDIFTCKRRGVFNEEIYIHRFRTTFKEANSIDRTLHYPIFATWMGKLRELPLQLIAPQLIADMTSGLWGMVTNSSYIKIVGTANSLDLIEGHFWVNRCYGKYNSTIDLCFKWHKVRDDNTLEVIAYSFLPSTWVKVTGHGIVEVAPFPQYFQKWVNDIVAQDNARDYLKDITSYPERCDLGKLLLKNNIPLQSRENIYKSDFNTSLDESNLVGNIYYAHYYAWQAKTFDQFIYNNIADFYRFDKKQRRFICLNTKIEHLREAMPFDKIEVRLYVDEIYEAGLQLSYEFFCISRKEPEKLAWGQQKVALVEGSQDYTSCNLAQNLIEKCLGNNKIKTI